ncbi:MAG TPA: hypothetical protein VMT52_09640, partial [Planctomycetota bacterium]|nr:hypothetical protein [Planctomycetota bacterium]
MTRSTSTPWISPLVLGALLFTPRSAAADEPDPFEALIDGRVRNAASGAEALRVSVPGRGSTPLRPDGTYRLEGIPVGLPVRAFGIPDSAEMGPGAWRPIISSEVRILDAAAGFDSQADLLSPGKASPPVFALGLAGPDGSTLVTLSSVGRTARLIARGVTASGAPYGRIHGPLESPAVRIESSDPSVASVSSSGEVTAVGPGLAWVRVFGDGEWAQVL